RIVVARTRARSARNTASIAAALCTRAVYAGSADRHHRADLDRAELRTRDPLGELGRFIEILGLDQVEAAELLAGLGERAVGGRHLAAAHAHRRRGVRR